MMSIKSCREKSGLSCASVATSLNIDSEQYQKYEDYIEDMPLSVGVIFAKIVKEPVDNILFFNLAI